MCLFDCGRCIGTLEEKEGPDLNYLKSDPFSFLEKIMAMKRARALKYIEDGNLPFTFAQLNAIFNFRCRIFNIEPHAV